MTSHTLLRKYMSDPLPYKIHRHLLQHRGAADREIVSSVTSHKEYPRMPRITLPRCELKMPLEDALSRRTSGREKKSDAAITVDELGGLLQHALAERADGKRNYPSGGALFPIETYVLAQNIKGVQEGIYHYHPKTHALEHLWSVKEHDKIFVSQSAWAESAPAIIILTSLWQRNYEKYGDFGYLLGILEAGHIAQNLLLVATALNLSSCPIAGFRGHELEQILDLDEREQPVYTVVISDKLT